MGRYKIVDGVPILKKQLPKLVLKSNTNVRIMRGIIWIWAVCCENRVLLKRRAAIDRLVMTK